MPIASAGTRRRGALAPTPFRHVKTPYDTLFEEPLKRMAPWSQSSCRIAFDKDRDVAVIKVHGNDFRILALGDSSKLQVGEEVVAIGSPLSLEYTVSNGIVSGIRHPDEGGERRNFLQTTAPISPGSSGGPLFNMAGEVVGITTAHLEGGENLNFAVPINDAKTLMTRASQVLSFPDEPDNAKPLTK